MNKNYFSKSQITYGNFINKNIPKGKKYRNFTVIERAPDKYNIAPLYVCLCVCGEKSTLTVQKLKHRFRKPTCDYCKDKNE